MTLERLTYAAYLLVALAGGLVVVFLNIAATSGDKHARGIELLGQLRQHEAGLTREVMRVASFRLVEYDGLVRLNRELGRLRREVTQGGWFTGPQFDVLLRDYRHSSDRRMRLQEHIKTLAALLRNAHHYLPNALSAWEQGHQREQVLALSRYLVRLLRFSLMPGLAERQVIEAGLAELRSELGNGDKAPIVALLDQMQAAVRWSGELEQALGRYLAVPVDDDLDRLEAEAEALFAAQSRHLRQLSAGLMVTAALLFVGLGVAMRRLRGAQRSSEQASERLRDAIESLSESFALFDRDGRLQMWNRHFEYDYAHAAVQLCQGLSFQQLMRFVEQGQVDRADKDWDQGLQHALKHSDEPYVQAMADGRFRLLTTSITSDGGRVLVGVDITQQKQVEAELRKLSQVVEQSPVSVMLTGLDGVIEYVNPMFERMTGYTSAEVLGRTPRTLKVGRTEQAVYQALWESPGGDDTWQGEFQNRRADGTTYWESALISPLRDAVGEVSHYVALKQDITGRKQNEEQLRLAATVFEKSREGLLVTSAENRIKLVNPAFCTITGYCADEVIGKTPSLLSSGRQSTEFYQQMWAALNGEGHWEGEVWNRRKSGEIYAEWLSVTAIRDHQGRAEEYVAVFSDITRRLQAEERIRYQANYDALTQLPNRSLLLDRLGTAVAEARRRHNSFAVLFADLDRFKPVNDSLGHQAGDELLRQVAGRLSELVRGNDTVARLSGDEFVLILNGMSDRDGAAGMAERVNRALAQPFELDGQQVFIGSSVGISVYPQDAEDTTTLLRNADMAMYRAKQAGRGTYRFFTEEMDAYITERLALDRDMRLGLGRGQFLLHYQPIIDPRSRCMLGAEALVRWQHPERGLLGPDSFVPLAEETGTIVGLGAWVLRTACAQGAAWQQAGVLDFSLSVNLSSRQIRGGLSGSEVAEILQETGFPADRLTLEITETLLLEENQEVIDWLQSVSALGVTLALDDFGTGYSSLGYLRRFPIDVLKIDRVFVSGQDEGQDLPLAEAILAMARSLNMRVVAEGVEDEQQLRFLSERGCDAVQGYLFSQPVSAGELLQYRDGLPGTVPDFSMPVTTR